MALLLGHVFVRMIRMSQAQGCCSRPSKWGGYRTLRWWTRLWEISNWTRRNKCVGSKKPGATDSFELCNTCLIWFAGMEWHFSRSPQKKNNVWIDYELWRSKHLLVTCINRNSKCRNLNDKTREEWILHTLMLKDAFSVSVSASSALVTQSLASSMSLCTQFAILAVIPLWCFWGQ